MKNTNFRKSGPGRTHPSLYSKARDTSINDALFERGLYHEPGSKLIRKALAGQIGLRAQFVKARCFDKIC